MACHERELAAGPGPAPADGGGGRTCENAAAADDRAFADFLNFLGGRDERRGETGDKAPGVASENSALRRRVAELESSLVRQAAQTSALEQEIEQLGDRLEQSRREKESVAKELRDGHEALTSALREEMQQLRLQLGRSRQEKESATRELREGNEIAEAQRLAMKEYESRCALQDAQANALKKETEQLRHELEQSQREKVSAVEQMREENQTIEAQRSALEGYLVELNRSAGSLREGAPPPTVGYGGEAPVRAAQVAALREENGSLRLTAETLRQTVETLRQSFAMLEEEKRTAEEEMDARLSCREATIEQLEGSLQQLQRAARLRFSKTSSRRAKRHSIFPTASPDDAASGQ